MSSSPKISRRLDWFRWLFTRKAHLPCHSNSVLPLHDTSNAETISTSGEISPSTLSTDNLIQNPASASISTISSAHASASFWKNRAFQHHTTVIQVSSQDSPEEPREERKFKPEDVLGLLPEYLLHDSIDIPEESDSGSVYSVQTDDLKTWRDPFLVPATPRPESGDGENRIEDANEPEDGGGNAPEDQDAGAGESESQDQKTTPSQYLQLYYDMMFYTGFCTYKPRWNSPEKKPIWWRVLGFIQKTTFWTLALLSLLESVCQAKFTLLQLMNGGGYDSCVTFAYNFGCFLAKMYAINLFGFRKAKTEAMLRETEEYENWSQNDGQRKKPTNSSSWKRKLVVALIISTLAFGCTSGFFGIVTGEKKIKDLVLASSHEFSQDLFIWHSNVTDETDNALEDQFGTNITATTITFGFTVILRNAASFMVLGTIFDLVVLVAVVVHSYVNAFMKEVIEVTDNVPRENVMEWTQLQARREVVWAKYRFLKRVANAVNDVFDHLLKLMHGGNLAMFAFFLLYCLTTNTTSWTNLLEYAMNLVKVEACYYIAGCIAEVNDIIRAWLRNWALYTGKIRVGEDELDINVILDELDKEPLGLGKGKFLIHHTFHFKFLGLVGTTFYSILEEYNKS